MDEFRPAMGAGVGAFARLSCSLLAFALGWTLYMIGMVLNSYDGCLSLIFQPISAALFSALSVAICLLFGLVLWLPGIRTLWRSSHACAALVASASLFVLLFGYSLGWTFEAIHPETGSRIVMLHPNAALGGYLGLLFAVTNWPILRRR